MGKTPKVKKREVSIHSRAAKRNASPPPKGPAAKPTADEGADQEWMYRAQNAGISKKKKPLKKLTRQQRLRQQKGFDNAERNIDRHEKKVADSKNRGRKVQARRAEWEDLNDKFDGREKPLEVSKKQHTNGTKEDGAKAMEGVEMPDLDKPVLPHTAENDMVVEAEPVSIARPDSPKEAEVQPVAAPLPAKAEPVAGASVGEVDDIT